jgi:hypothetical protein
LCTWVVRTCHLPAIEVLPPESTRLQSELVTYLVPRAGAIVRLIDGHAHVEAGAWGASFEGPLADDVARIATGHVSPRLEALARSNPAVSALVSWRDHAWLPLTVLDAVRPSPSNPSDVFDGDAMGICKQFYFQELSPTDTMRIEKLTGWHQPSDVFGRDDGIRVVGSIIAEIATRQHYNWFFILEGSPTQRALFSNDFSKSMFGDDLDFYFKLGISYKF